MQRRVQYRFGVKRINPILDSRLRGNDDGVGRVIERLRIARSVKYGKHNSGHVHVSFGEYNPACEFAIRAPYAIQIACDLKYVLSRDRACRNRLRTRPPHVVIPAQAGIQRLIERRRTRFTWRVVRRIVKYRFGVK